MTAILGGGITGLSAGFYALENRLGPLVLLESSERLGGWIRTVELPNGTIFEMGPRTVRPKGPAGKNTLRMIDRLKLTEKIIPISSSHPSAKTRMIYANDELHVLPNSLIGLLKKFGPTKERLAKSLLKDLTSPKVAKDDESMYSFVERRFDKNIADYLISSMLCGICAGDAKKISVNFLMSGLFEAEQKHGSIVGGLIATRIEKFLFERSKKNDDGGENGRENFFGSAEIATKDRWSVWGLRGGLEQLPKRLAEELILGGVDVRLNEKCRGINFRENFVELEINDRIVKFDGLVAAISAKSLAPLLEIQHPQLARELSAIPAVTVAVVNLEFPGKCLDKEAFGFLVPPKEKIPILGVIFDSCVFENENSTVLTVMMGGAWFDEYFGSSPKKDYLLSVALEQVKKILRINVEPVAKNVAILKDCIPQHVVGHKQRLTRIQNYITAHKLPLALCGSSYQGVGLNDVILSAKQAVRDTIERKKIPMK